MTRKEVFDYFEIKKKELIQTFKKKPETKVELTKKIYAHESIEGLAVESVVKNKSTISFTLTIAWNQFEKLIQEWTSGGVVRHYIEILNGTIKDSEKPEIQNQEDIDML